MLTFLRSCVFLFFLAGFATFAHADEITRLWLTHRSPDPSHLVVSWTSDQPGDSVVYFGAPDQPESVVRTNEAVTLHHVEIPLDANVAEYRYRVSSGEHSSAPSTFKTYRGEVVRAAVVANWHEHADLSAIAQDNVHLLLTAGDNISQLWKDCGAGKLDCIQPYLNLIDRYPDLFRTTPFMPILGNHDREIRQRGGKPPLESVYDVDATAYRRMFELPGDEWKWKFEIPQVGVRFVALDLHHLSDFGTTWQTGHAFDAQSPQFQWYQQIVTTDYPCTVTLYNERNSAVRNLAGGKWGEALQHSSLCITGYGHFSEMADVNGVPFVDTSLTGKGNVYADPKSTFIGREDNYVLLTFAPQKSMTIELKSLAGKVMHQRLVNFAKPN